jgi:hypothetical protein
MRRSFTFPSLKDEERQAEARRYVTAKRDSPLAAIAKRELRSGHLQMGAPWLRQGGDHVSCGGAERGPAPVNEPDHG